MVCKISNKKVGSWTTPLTWTSIIWLASARTRTMMTRLARSVSAKKVRKFKNESTTTATAATATATTTLSSSSITTKTATTTTITIKRLAISRIKLTATATIITKTTKLTAPWFARSTTRIATKNLVIGQQHEHQQWQSD
jgi:hypothetical protein